MIKGIVRRRYACESFLTFSFETNEEAAGQQNQKLEQKSNKKFAEKLKLYSTGKLEILISS